VFVVGPKMSFYTSPAQQRAPRRQCDFTAYYRDDSSPSAHPPKHSMLFLPPAGPAGTIPGTPNTSLSPLPMMRQGPSQQMQSPQISRPSIPYTPILYRKPLPSIPRMTPIFRAPVPMPYSLCERLRVGFTSGDQIGVLVSECIRTNYTIIDNGHMPVRCFAHSLRIPWALMWPGYSSDKTHVIDLRGLTGFTLRALAQYICQELAQLQRTIQDACVAGEEKWALGKTGIRLDQIWLIAFGRTDADDEDLWAPEFEVTTSHLPYTT